MKKLFTLIALLAISLSSMAQWLPQASGFTAASRGIKYMHAVDANVVWATAYDGSGGGAVIQEFTRTINGGELWVPGVVNNATGLEFAMIFGIDANTAYAAMYKTSGNNPQGIYKTIDGGLTWNHQATALFNNASSFTNVVHFFDANNGFAQGDPINGEFELYTTNNGGTTWMPVLGSNIPNPISGEWGVVGYYSAVGETIWFGTNKGRVFRSTDMGHNWEVFTCSLGATFLDVRFSSALHGLAQDKGSSSTGRFAETFDGGETWTTIVAAGPTLTADFAYVPGTEMTYVATGSNPDLANQLGIAFSYDGGHNWEFFPDTEGVQFLAVDFVDPETGWVGAFNESATVGGMYKFNGSLVQPMPPTNLTAEVVENTVTLSWTAPENLGNSFIGYNVWRNAAIIAPLITETTYVDAGLASGAYTYMVTAVFENGESEPSNTVEVEIINPAAQNVPVVENLMVYPNPSNGVLNVKADSKINMVQLINLTGQVVYESSVMANETVINTTSMNKGLYLLNVIADKGIVTHRISVR